MLNHILLMCHIPQLAKVTRDWIRFLFFHTNKLFKYHVNISHVLASVIYQFLPAFELHCDCQLQLLLLIIRQSLGLFVCHRLQQVF